MHPMMNIAIKAARKAGKVILEANDKRQSIQVSEKSRNNYVTNYDVAAEKVILEIIQQARPDDYFITEESGEFGNERAAHTWIIDPIDGTNNFIHGIPHNCIAIGMQYHGKTELAVIYNPHLDQLFTATKGSGAQLNGQRIRVSTRKEFKGGLISASIKYSPKVFKNTYPLALLKLNEDISGYRYSGSLALDLCYLACGYIDGLWTSRPAKIWDIEPAVLIAREAGAVVSEPNGGNNVAQSGILVAANPKLATKLIKHLAPHVIV